MPGGPEGRAERAEAGAAGKCQAAVRLRQPERRQMAMVVQCPDDLVSATHPVRRVAEVVEHLDLSGFCPPIKAREGVAGRDATDPKLLVALWLYACVRGIGSGRELARQCQENVRLSLAVRGRECEPSFAVGFSHRSWEGLGPVIHAGDCLAGGQGRGEGEPDQPGRDAGAGGSGERAVFGGKRDLEKLLAEAKRHVEELQQQLESPEVPRRR